jgi:hypothetical protein
VRLDADQRRNSQLISVKMMLTTMQVTIGK